MFSKRINIKMLASVFVLVMTLCVSALAAINSGSWSVNPADYRYDMSLYFSLADRSLEDLDAYEIGAFIDDECRGVAQLLPLTGGESCLYMRIRSNRAEGAAVEFRMRQKGSDDFVVLRPADGSDFIFKSNDRVGMPSAPFVLARWFNVEVKAGEHGAVDFEDGMYREGTELTLKAVPEEGFHLSKWSDGNTEAERTLIVSGDIFLTAEFEINIYKAVFKIDDEVFETIEYAYGAPVVAPEAPEKEGYTFSGWSEYPATMPASDINVTGSYTVNVYTLTFMVDGEIYKVMEIAFGSVIEVPDAPAKEGYTFEQWLGLPERMAAEDLTVSAVYSVNFYRLVVYLDGEVYMEEDIEYGADVVVPDPEIPDGRVFDGWKEEIPSTMPAHDVEIYGTTSEIIAVSVISFGEDPSLDVYSLGGVLLFKGAKASELKNRLSPGLYIINGKKYIIR